MNWLEDLNRAMGSIEEQLPGPVAIDKVAQAAACSEFHLQRMFPYLTGITLAEYIRRRRLSLAALELSAGHTVTEVAMEFGYESPTAFSRAFKALHGVVPSQVNTGKSRSRPIRASYLAFL